jgi:Putative 2OG-Fe(II) oxygenase
MNPRTADSARTAAIALLREQNLLEAHAVLAHARTHHPQDAALAALHAQTSYELGYAAASLFATAYKLAPHNLALLRNKALAHASEGEGGKGIALLEARLKTQPDWLDGHKSLANMRYTSGDAHGFTRTLQQACGAQPRNLALWLLWLQILVQAKDWPEARRVLAQAQAACGEQPQLLIIALLIASETHDEQQAEALLAMTTQWQDDSLSLCRVRHALRRGRVAVANAEAQAMHARGGISRKLVWPYLSLIWRLKGDAQSAWLDGAGGLAYVRSTTLDMNTGELERLGGILRALHIAHKPYVEQSVRGGTQTDRSLLLRHEPELQQLRTKLMAKVREYIAALPPPDGVHAPPSHARHDIAHAPPFHPLLSSPRTGLRIAGSWSVRLGAGGHNVSHTHPMGWLSTAFYVSLGENAQAHGAAPAGHISFGEAPAELGINLPAYGTIAPQAGRLVIFPSTMWHRTIPIEAGERLALAFDIVAMGDSAAT